MARKNYEPISLFWFAFMPAVVLGVGYLVWHSNGFLSEQVQYVFGPLVRYVQRQVGRLF